MFSKFLYIVGFTALLFMAGGFFLPRFVHVERSLEIERSSPPVFALLNSYKTFASWSPWAERDPDANYEFSGPESGVGARMSWSGDPRLVGSGWQEIIESVPHSLVRTRLFFDQQGAAESYFQLDETERGVLVTWGFDTDLTEGQSFLGGLLARYFGLMFDRWIGTDYEQGLARLKVYAESLPNPQARRSEIGVVELEASPFFYIPVDEVIMADGQQPESIAASLSIAFSEMSSFMAANDLLLDGQPLAINRGGGEKGYELWAAIPVPINTEQPNERIRLGNMPAGRAARIVHLGSYENMAASYQKLTAYMDVHGLNQGAVSWEHYLSGLSDPDSGDQVTHIYIQIAD